MEATMKQDVIFLVVYFWKYLDEILLLAGETHISFQFTACSLFSWAELFKRRFTRIFLISCQSKLCCNANWISERQRIRMRDWIVPTHKGIKRVSMMKKKQYLGDLSSSLLNLYPSTFHLFDVAEKLTSYSWNAWRVGLWCSLHDQSASKCTSRLIFPSSKMQQQFLAADPTVCNVFRWGNTTWMSHFSALRGRKGVYFIYIYLWCQNIRAVFSFFVSLTIPGRQNSHPISHVRRSCVAFIWQHRHQSFSHALRLFDSFFFFHLCKIAWIAVRAASRSAVHLGYLSVFTLYLIHCTWIRDQFGRVLEPVGLTG